MSGNEVTMEYDAANRSLSRITPGGKTRLWLLPNDDYRFCVDARGPCVNFEFVLDASRSVHSLKLLCKYVVTSFRLDVSELPNTLQEYCNV